MRRTRTSAVRNTSRNPRSVRHKARNNLSNAVSEAGALTGGFGNTRPPGIGGHGRANAIAGQSGNRAARIATHERPARRAFHPHMPDCTNSRRRPATARFPDIVLDRRQSGPVARHRRVSGYCLPSRSCRRRPCRRNWRRSSLSTRPALRSHVDADQLLARADAIEIITDRNRAGVVDGRFL